MRAAKARTKSNALRTWMRNATMLERKRLAKTANTTEGHLRQVSGGYRTGGAASTTPDLARQLEFSSLKMQRDGLPPLSRESLCPACGRCELAKRARETLPITDIDPIV